jgi:hypothetical protein
VIICYNWAHSPFAFRRSLCNITNVTFKIQTKYKLYILQLFFLRYLYTLNCEVCYLTTLSIDKVVNVGWIWVNFGIILTGKNRNTLKNHVSLPHFLPQTLHRMTWVWTRATSVRHRRLTAWTKVYFLINRNLRPKSFLQPSLWQKKLSEVACPNCHISKEILLCVHENFEEENKV